MVYVGMAWAGRRGGIRGRLARHAAAKEGWTHFSVFEVWDNIRNEEVAELEGLFRQIYRRDQRANRLNAQRSFKKMKRIPAILEDPVSRKPRRAQPRRHRKPRTSR